tara:strand:- start:1016 stop:2053 length:1038 start_codon:yes stop_codon:yes gene_type:complete
MVKTDITIRQAMKKLNETGQKCLVLTNEENILAGTLSDGDLRKAILQGFAVDDSVEGIYQTKPTALVEGKYDIAKAKKLFTKNKFDLIPIVNEKGKLVDLLFWENVFKKKKNVNKGQLETPVVIMAGGRGTRLEPFTKVLPKPLVPIHDKPVIEHIIDRFTEVGVNEFILTINYKARIMKAFFEELQPEFSVDFLEEKEPLGTAGSLKFLNGKFKEPFLVTNSDIIINSDYPDLYDFHKENNYDITLVASMKNYTIPYGTCELNKKGHLKNINEKPEYNFLVNTGLYVMNPDVLDLIPSKRVYHITHLIEEAKKRGRKVGVYPIDDDAWIDIGEWAEYQKAVERL